MCHEVNMRHWGAEVECYDLEVVCLAVKLMEVDLCCLTLMMNLVGFNHLEDTSFNVFVQVSTERFI